MFTSDDIAALKAAIASGARRVRYSDSSEVEYRTLAEMRETLRMMQQDVAPSGGSTSSRSFVAGF
jgi:hypothetical protein